MSAFLKDFVCILVEFEPLVAGLVVFVFVSVFLQKLASFYGTFMLIKHFIAPDYT